MTAIELLPVFQFDALAAPAGRLNYWGYQPISFFAPHAAYASRPGPTAPLDEFRDMVKAMHRAGLEVILDVVYNHTAEGGADGPTTCFKGLANDDYYLLDPDDRATYTDFSGTGNTFKGNGAIVRRLILDSLRYWVEEMHVDGFRFDLAAVLSRGEDGEPLSDPPILWEIETDPVLAGTKLIAEAWDAGGLYQVGSFVGDRWVEWNGRFRDDMRSFMRAEPGKVRDLTQRFLGSPDIYGHKHRDAQASINFVTCHDGFTLNDLVSYEQKHNEANGEDNRDGNDWNMSWNCGVEGPTDDPAIEAIRRRQIKNFLVVNLLSLGVPMLLMGDEVRRTQGGNNNAYCANDATSWFDWSGPRAQRRHPALHQGADQDAPPAGDAARRARGDQSPGHPRQRVARMERGDHRPARLRGVLAQHGAHAAGRAGRPAHHLQRLLGAARLRAAAARGPARRVAPDRRHEPRRPG